MMVLDGQISNNLLTITVKTKLERHRSKDSSLVGRDGDGLQEEHAMGVGWRAGHRPRRALLRPSVRLHSIQVGQDVCILLPHAPQDLTRLGRGHVPQLDVPTPQAIAHG